MGINLGLEAGLCDPPEISPEGYGVLKPGDFLIIQLHYHFDYSAPPDLSQMLFDFASTEQLEANGGSFKNRQLFRGPAEIPCYEGDQHPLCDRDTAIKRAVELYGDAGYASNSSTVNVALLLKTMPT